MLALLILSVGGGPSGNWGLGRSVAAPSPSSGFAETVTTFSQSGQFVVTGPRTTPSLSLQTRLPTDRERNLTPQTLAVSCEQVKRGILDLLGLPDLWRTGGGGMGKILVSIDATVRTNRSIGVQASPYERGWQFRVALPTRMDETRLVRGLTQAILLELANRQGNQRLGEPPLWWVEGVTQAVLANSPEGLILQPRTRAMVVVHLDETLAKVREQLGRRAPLAFHELAQPDLDSMDPRAWEHYGACAHLCVRELLRLPDGRQRLVRWMGSLQSHWNWQTGFTEAFSPGFRSLLDVEKWWAISLAHFTGRGAAATWPPPFALRKLEDALRPFGIRPGGAARAERLNLEEVIVTWDFDRQLPLLRQLFQQLHAIRLSSPPEVAALVYRYIDVLDEYLTARGRQGSLSAMRGQIPASVKLVTRRAVGRLRELEGERHRLQASPPEASPGATGTPAS